MRKIIYLLLILISITYAQTDSLKTEIDQSEIQSLRERIAGTEGAIGVLGERLLDISDDNARSQIVIGQQSNLMTIITLVVTLLISILAMFTYIQSKGIAKQTARDELEKMRNEITDKLIELEKATDKVSEDANILRGKIRRHNERLERSANKIEAAETIFRMKVKELLKFSRNNDLNELPKDIFSSEEIEAIQEANRQIDEKPFKEISAEEWYVKGHISFQNKDYDNAVRDLSESIKKKPDYTEAYLMRGAARDRLGDYDGSINDYSKAIELKPDFADAYNNRGIAKGNINEHVKAIPDFSKAIDLDPADHEAYFNRGISMMSTGDMNQAVDDFNSAIKLHPNYTKAYHERGKAHETLGSHDLAIADFTKAIEIAPKSSGIYYDRGMTRDKMGEHRGAITDFDHAIDLKPEYKEAHFSRGKSKKASGDMNGAIEDFKKVQQIDPTEKKVISEMADAKEKSGDFRSAIDDYTAALSDSDEKEKVSIYYKRGKVKAQMGDYEHAIDDFNKAIELNPLSYKTYNSRANARLEMDNIVGAIADYSKAIVIDSNFRIAYSNRSTAFLRLASSQSIPPGEHELFRKAKQDAKKAVELSRGKYGYYNLGCAEARMLDVDHALKHLETAISKRQVSVEHVAKDKDLEHLYDNEDFQKLIAKYSRKAA